MGITATHTYVELELSASAYEEITQKLRASGYGHCFDGKTIDMHGLGIIPEPGSELMRCTVTGFIVATYFKAEFPKLPRTTKCDCEVGMCTRRKDCRQL